MYETRGSRIKNRENLQIGTTICTVNDDWSSLHLIVEDSLRRPCSYRYACNDPDPVRVCTNQSTFVFAPPC